MQKFIDGLEKKEDEAGFFEIFYQKTIQKTTLKATETKACLFDWCRGWMLHFTMGSIDYSFFSIAGQEVKPT